jgi:hypothetical protein
LSTRNFLHELAGQWFRTTDIVDRHLERLGFYASRTLYHILSITYLALITDAGLLIIAFTPLLFKAQLIAQEFNISLVFLIGYVICDLIRLPFRHGATISLGFPLIFLTVLADSPFAALRNAALGSLLSEALYSILISKQRCSWSLALRRALFYAGHHAVAGLGALTACQLASGRLYLPIQETMRVDVLSVLAYVVTYSLISMLLVWPYDRQIQLFLACNEGSLVRIDFFTTLLLLPLPASTYYLYNLSAGEWEKMIIAVSILPPLFILLFFLARNYTKLEEERVQLTLKEQISQLLGDPANVAELMERVLTIIGGLVDYRWGAAYSLSDEELVLCGVKPAKGPVRTLDLDGTEEAWWPSKDFGKDKGQVAWPKRLKPGEGFLGKMVKAYLSPQFFDQARAPITVSEPYLPRKTALAVYPIASWQRESEEVFLKPIGMIVVARPRRMFTTWEWEKGRVLSERVSSVLLGAQRLEKVMREISQQVKEYATDPERVRQAVHALIQRQVDVSKFLAAVSEYSFQNSLRAVLKSVIERRRGSGIALAPETLTQIYNQVRDRTPGMPPLNEEIFQLLQTLTSCLSLVFSFPYHFPDVERGSTFKEFYEFLLVALDANTVPCIIALDSQINDTVKAIKAGRKPIRQMGGSVAADLTALPLEALEEVEKLREVIPLLGAYNRTEDLGDQEKALDQALSLLKEREKSVRERLRDPERFAFLQTLSCWHEAINKALANLKQGPAHLQVSLRNRQALSLQEKTVAGLVLKNQGPGVASSVVVQLQPSSDYEILEETVDIGTLIRGKSEELEFALQPIGEGPLRLHFGVTYNDPERKGKVEEFADLLYLRELPPNPGDIPNPYTPGMPLKLGNPTFFGRDDIFKFIHQSSAALIHKTILVLIGERRTGKTSILKQLPARLNNSGSIPIYIDGQQLGIDPGMSSFFLSLTGAIADGLTAAGIPISPLTPEDLKETPQYVFERQFLPMVRDRIGDRVLLLTIDEFEELGDRVKRGRLQPEIFPYLRHLIQHGEQLAFIFAGTHRIEELIGDYWSVLFNIALYRKVSFLDREETVRLITEPVQPYGVMYDDLAVDEIISLTACHPYFTQLLCNLLVNRCNEAECNYVTVQDVRDAVEELLETGRAHLTFLWGTSDQEDKLTLAALAELRAQLDQVTIAAIIDRISAYQLHIDPGQITRAMEKLTARDIVREIPDNPVSYDFSAQLYAHWLRRYKPLSKIVEEVSNEQAPGEALLPGDR